ncbi:MAG: NADH-quinone oxidoreductase subunit H [Phycisphaeraceae bacterium]|nr:MAG: NADH-quinone oxidoreductase subunit H [Phycisphaeraceae bacterium]
MPTWFNAQLVTSALTIIVMVHVILVTCAYLVYFERKISAYIQDRIGPNRVGFDFGLPALAFLKGCIGLGQSLADGIKFVLKEDYTPARVDKVLFTLAPAIIIVPALIGFIIIPWGGTWSGVLHLPFMEKPIVDAGEVVVVGANINVGVVYLLAVAALGVYGVTLGGWASNNKFSFLGGLRATAQMISYEIPMGLSILAVLLLVGSLGAMSIAQYQFEHGWLVFSQPLAFVLFYICSLAESNRAPFDNAEAEQELVGGYHTEYSAMRFAMFFLAEYAHLVTGTAFLVLLFLGAWEPLPFVTIWGDEATGILGVLAKAAIFMGKVVLLVCFGMVIRWTIPRLRYDQVMMMAWSALIPLSLLVVVATSVMVYLGKTGMGWMLAANGACLVLALLAQPFMPRALSNRRVPLYGSRFSPVAGEAVNTAPTDAMALEDRPVQGTAALR